MKVFNIDKQIKRLYAVTSIGYFQIAGASWVALLALRGFSLLEIGILESIFHVVSICFELPSGVLADVFGRKKTLVASQAASLISSVLMMLSSGFGTVAFAIGFSALSYNLASGAREALAYDSLKVAQREADYNKFASTEMVLYRITNSTATLCAGLALWLGYRKAYFADMIFNLVALAVACGLTEIRFEADVAVGGVKVIERVKTVMKASIDFLVGNRLVRRIMMVNSMIGAVSTLVLFFLQARLPEEGLPKGLLGPALFIMGMGAALGSKLVSYFPALKYRRLLLFSGAGVIFAFAASYFRAPVLILIVGGFIGALCDDFLEVRTDVILNGMIPSEQRATLVSVNSFMFSVIMIILSTVMGWMLG